MSARPDGWHSVSINGRAYRIEVRDGEVRNIYGRRELIVPGTAHLVAGYQRYTTVRTDIDPEGRLGRKIVQALQAEGAR